MNHRNSVYMEESGTQIGGNSAVELLPMTDLVDLDDHTLFLQLHRAVVTVLSAKEAMWEELKELMKQERNSLYIYGWEENEFDERSSRKKFNCLVERYKR